jgi:6-pyruvoyltetrahydropterin/6-carboxytetrahydropterin synthase
MSHEEPPEMPTPIWKVRKSFEFSAAHRLVNHDGQCNRTHGHNYKLIVELTDTSLFEDGSDTGMVLDFADISRAYKSHLAPSLDHQNLNHTLDTDNPTAEVIARWAYQTLKPVLSRLSRVIVEETGSCEAEYAERGGE